MNFWYSTNLTIRACLLLPLAWLVLLASYLKRVRRNKVPYSKPVIVVGNLTVGGTGKTPTIIWLIQQLKAKGLRAAVVSRGYGAKPTTSYPVLVTSSLGADQVGDEPKLIADKTQVPVVIDPARHVAVEFVCQHFEQEVDVIISDDGMQHYGMFRDLEILMVDAVRGFGNRQLLPAGPLRESTSRLADFEFILAKESPEKQLTSKPIYAASIVTQTPVNRFGAKLTTKDVVVSSGIGHFASFLQTVKSQGLTVKKCVEFKDHQPISVTVLADSRYPIVVTEKDFIKLVEPPAHVYQLPFELSYGDDITRRLIQKVELILDEKSHHHSGTT